MTQYPKFKLHLEPGECSAKRVRPRSKAINTDGMGAGIMASIAICAVIWLVMWLIFNPVVATSVALTIGIVLLSCLLFSGWIGAEMTESSDKQAFWIQSARSNWFAVDVHILLEEALAHPSYSMDAETIIEAGIAGFKNTVDRDGQIRVSLVLDEALSKLKGQMQEQNDVENTTAEDVTKGFLEGYR